MSFWTEREKAELIELHKKGRSREQAARALHRSKDSIDKVARRRFTLRIGTWPPRFESHSVSVERAQSGKEPLGALMQRKPKPCKAPQSWRLVVSKQNSRTGWRGWMLRLPLSMRVFIAKRARFCSHRWADLAEWIVPELRGDE